MQLEIYCVRHVHGSRGGVKEALLDSPGTPRNIWRWSFEGPEMAHLRDLEPRGEEGGLDGAPKLTLHVGRGICIVI